ncbi:hypothetical protein [Acidithiobacillus sp.]|uniref:hypothetical protein n=1 Tax=Acidithiobacillus sp. TaxID=1872118 RepID=UPI003CFFF233
MGDSLRNILSKIAEISGFKPSEQQQLAAYAQKLALAKAENIDNIESVKAEIRRIEEEARKLGEEYEKSHGQTREITRREIELKFSDLDRHRERVTVIAQNIENISLAQEKIRTIQAAAVKGIAEQDFDDIAESVREEFATLKDADKAAKDLDKETYQRAARPEMDVDARVAELRPDSTRSTELPPELRKRLDELKADPE